MLLMVYKMGRCAEKSWRRLRGFRHLAKVIEGVRFNDGIEVTEVDREGVFVEGACVEPSVEMRECAQVGAAGVGREGVAHQGGSGGRDGRGGPGGRDHSPSCNIRVSRVMSR